MDQFVSSNITRQSYLKKNTILLNKAAEMILDFFLSSIVRIFILTDNSFEKR